MAAALEQLRTEDRDLICYHYGAGWSYREIAKMTGVDAAALRKRMQRLRGQVREALETERREK